MKKRLLKLTAILLVVLFVFSLAGCSQEKKEGEETTPPAKKQISIITGSSAGAWYLVAGGMAKVINQNMPEYEVTVEPGGGGSENIVRVAEKECMFGMVMADCLYFGVNGGREFPEGYPEIKAIYGGHNNPMKLLARKDSGITDIMQLRDKRVAIGYAGSSQAQAANAVMEAHGLVADKDYKAVWITPAEIAEALQDGNIDAGFYYPADPAGPLIELCSKVDIQFVSYDVKTVIEKNPYYYETFTPGGIYKGLDEDYPAQGCNVVLMTHEDTDPELVYQITKLLIENVDAVGEAHPAGKEWNIDNATRGIVTDYHPGAEKYLKERGVL